MVCTDKSRYRVLVAGRRFGKTTLAVTELILDALSSPNKLLWYVAPSYRQAKMIAWRMMKNMISPELNPKYNESELSVTMMNGSIIELKGADNEDSLRGAGLHGMVIDEFATIYDNWSVLNEVLRPALADHRGWILFIGTPKGKDAFWELFMQGQKGDNNYKSWQFTTLDNPFIDPEEVYEAQKTMPERYFKQEFEASFEDFVGLIYPEFDEKEHVVEPYYLQTIFNRIGCIDTAVTGTTGALKAAIDEDGTLWVYDEYYGKDKRVSEVCPEIKEDGVRWFIDPQAKDKTYSGGKEYSLYHEYMDNGIVAEDAQKNVMAGINRVGEYFKSGKIKIFSTCRNLIWELERYHWAESKESIKGEVLAQPYKKDDHLVDCLRYLVMSRAIESDMHFVAPKNEESAWNRMQRKLNAPQEGVYTR